MNKKLVLGLFYHDNMLIAHSRVKGRFYHVCKWCLLLIFILLLWSFYSAEASLRRSHETTKDHLARYPVSISSIFSFLIPQEFTQRPPRLQPTNLIWCKIFQICHCFRHSSYLWSSTCLLRPKLKANLQEVKNPRTHHLITAKPYLEQKNQR